MSGWQHGPIFEAIRERRLTLFIGADFPHRVTGLPGRAELARALAERYSLRQDLGLAEVAQRIGPI